MVDLVDKAIRRLALDDQAEASLFKLGLEQNPKTEHMGALYEMAGQLEQSPSLVEGNGQHVRGTLSKPPGAMWAALFHNHPPAGRGTESSAEVFSPDDIAQARRLGIPSYISTPAGRTKSFDPATNKTTDVLAAFPWDVLRSHLMKVMGRAPDDPRGLMLP